MVKIDHCRVRLLDRHQAHDDGTNQCVRSIGDIEFLEDGGEVVLCRLRTDVEPLRNLPVGGTFGEQLQHFQFPLGERPRTPLPLFPVATGVHFRVPEVLVGRRARDRPSSASPERRACFRPGARSYRQTGRRRRPACRTSTLSAFPASSAGDCCAVGHSIEAVFAIPPPHSARPKFGAAPSPTATTRWKLPGHCMLFDSNDSGNTVAARVRPVKNEQFSAVCGAADSARVERVSDRTDDGSEDDDHDRRQEARVPAGRGS